jgi:toxin ParE1/3/4
VTQLAFRLTEQAGVDVEAILEDTATTFGPRQVEVYADLIERAVQRVADDPSHPSTSACNDIGAGVRPYHLELVAGRRGAASHLLYYMLGSLDDNRTGVIILRVLHEHMEPKQRVISAIQPRSGGADVVGP